MKKLLLLMTCLTSVSPVLTSADEHPARGHSVAAHSACSLAHYPMTPGSRRGAGAKKSSHRHGSHRDEPVYGRVVSVEPVYRVTPARDGLGTCVRYLDEPPRRRSVTPTLLGAVIGGAVGHRLGDRHGDPTAAAIAGGILGASVGRDIGRHHGARRRVVADGPCGYHARPQRREVVEYVVRYRYNDELFITRMDHDPGEWIALDVDIKPV